MFVFINLIESIQQCDQGKNKLATLITSHNMPTKVSPTESASCVGEVSAFVLSVVKRVIPQALFGGPENQKSITWSINRFIRLRRFESMSLHDIMQGLKVRILSASRVILLTRKD